MLTVKRVGIEPGCHQWSATYEVTHDGGTLWAPAGTCIVTAHWDMGSMRTTCAQHTECCFARSVVIALRDRLLRD